MIGCRVAGAVAACLCFVALGCGANSEGEGFRERASAPPSGIVETDGEGRIVSQPADDRDWETAPAYRGVLIFEPAYPNPATTSDEIRIPVNVRTFGSVQGGLYIERIRDGVLTRMADHPEVAEPGFYVLQFDAALFNTSGLYRVFVTDGRGEIVSYGDIRIQ